MSASRVIDADSHLMEPRDLWARYADPGDRSLALRIEDDEQGHAWLTRHDDHRIELALHQRPGDTEAVGEQLLAARRGDPADRSLEEATPPSYRDPAARLEWMNARGLDESVLFPNYGLAIERPLSAALPALLANLRAWNRYAVDVSAAGRGRLHPVGHVTLRDLDWLDRELASLADGGVRLAMTAPSLVDGRRLSHPDLDRAWSAFVEHGVTPVFHVGAFRRPFESGWYEDDPDGLNPVLSSVFLGTAPALALADLAVHGTLARHPELRLGVMELSAVWVPMFLLTLDGGFEFHRRFNGRPLTDLDLKPSEYVRRQVKVAAFSYESPDRLIEKAGDLFMACSDFPHSEGTATPVADYARDCPRAAEPSAAPGLFGDNVAWLLRR